MASRCKNDKSNFLAGGMAESTKLLIGLRDSHETLAFQVRKFSAAARKALSICHKQKILNGYLNARKVYWCCNFAFDDTVKA